MRELSRTYSNGYFITIFACCRQLYDFREMCGGVKKESVEENLVMHRARSEHHRNDFYRNH